MVLRHTDRRNDTLFSSKQCVIASREAAWQSRKASNLFMQSFHFLFYSGLLRRFAPRNDARGASSLRSEREGGFFTAFRMTHCSIAVGFKNCQESALGNGDLTDHLHALFAFLLLFQKFSLAGNIAAVTLCRNIFPECADR